jgi:hypothetical protein
MKNLNALMQNIIELTTVIETKYPELYKYLDETPLSIGKHPEKEISTIDLQSYLQTLKTLLEDYIETHQKPNLV